MYKVYSFLISLSPPRAPRWKKLCANREVKGVKGVKTTAFVDIKLNINHSLQGCCHLTFLTTIGSEHFP